MPTESVSSAVVAPPPDSADTPRNPAHFARGRPFQKGNPGKAKGTRNKVNAMADALLAENAEALLRKAIELAVNGNVTALRLCLDRVVPPRRQATVDAALPDIATRDDAHAATMQVTNLVAAGDLSPSEGQGLVRLFERQALSFAVQQHAAAHEERRQQSIARLTQQRRDSELEDALRDAWRREGFSVGEADD